MPRLKRAFIAGYIRSFGVQGRHNIAHNSLCTSVYGQELPPPPTTSLRECASWPEATKNALQGSCLDTSDSESGLSLKIGLKTQERMCVANLLPLVPPLLPSPQRFDKSWGGAEEVPCEV